VLSPLAIGVAISRRFSVTSMLIICCVPCSNAVCNVYSAAAQPAEQCTACTFSANSGRQAVLCFTSYIYSWVRQWFRRQGQIGGVLTFYYVLWSSDSSLFTSDPRKHLYRGRQQAVSNHFIKRTKPTSPSPAPYSGNQYRLRNRTIHNFQAPTQNIHPQRSKLFHSFTFWRHEL